MIHSLSRCNPVVDVRVSHASFNIIHVLRSSDRYLAFPSSTVFSDDKRRTMPNKVAVMLQNNMYVSNGYAIPTIKYTVSLALLLLGRARTNALEMLGEDEWDTQKR